MNCAISLDVEFKTSTTAQSDMCMITQYRILRVQQQMVKFTSGCSITIRCAYRERLYIFVTRAIPTAPAAGALEPLRVRSIAHVIIYLSIYLSLSLYIYIYICVCIYIYTHLHTHMCVCIYIYIYTRIQTCIHVCVYIYIYMCMYIYIYMYMYIH